MQWWCAVMVALAVLIWPWHGFMDARHGSSGALREHHSQHEENTAMPHRRIGIAQSLTAVIARMNAGGTLVEAYEELYGSRFATRKLTRPRLDTVLQRIRLPDETTQQVSRAAHGAYAAVQLSERLGCRISPCLEVVLASYRQLRLLQHARAQALAMPKATVGLLSVLPVGTILLGELMGGYPLRFLLGSARGWVCLALGGCGYVAGLAWTRALLKGR
ncbi:pilus assembly protein [Bifidobacterium sp. LC6]|uniref:Pilus assembly protein n=1 Tax=Bifidobacterium colobi TaxID=2809026 RepID=A0ABS5UT77_9BIFI|nr:pilus assembly protein [Bifidobacterium colobi]MBT1174232.1 pilus assembly protein [Bifidobacterium colobi]